MPFVVISPKANIDLDRVILICRAEISAPYAWPPNSFSSIAFWDSWRPFLKVDTDRLFELATGVNLFQRPGIDELGRCARVVEATEEAGAGEAV